MTKQQPHNGWVALARPGFLLSGWPWRGAAYALTTPLVGIAAAIPLWLFATPIVIAVGWAVQNMFEYRLGEMAVLTLLSAVFLTLFGPLVAAPLAYVERRRLKLIDTRPVARPPARNANDWLRDRYTNPAAWREFAYAGLLVTVLPLLYLAVAAIVLLVFVWIISPFLVSQEDPISIGTTQVSTAAETLPYAIGGIVLLPALPYLWTVLAAAHGTIARALLLSAAAGEDDLRTELVEVRRSRARLVDAFEAERRRIERDLHDGAQQRLVSLTLQLGVARVDLPADSPAAAAVADAHEQAKQLMAELRELIRGIHPRVLADRGLPAAISELADNLRVPVDVNASLTARLPSHLESTAYFVVAEALTNVAKHSGATSGSVSVWIDGRLLVTEVVDDGRGGADPYSGGGLTGLADRTAAVDGKMFLSSPAGGPTVVRVEIPCGHSKSG